MQIRPRLEAVIEDMLDGHIMLDEALEEFEKLYIQKAFTRNKKRISHTAEALGIHRNTISKRVNSYRAQERKHPPTNALDGIFFIECSALPWELLQECAQVCHAGDCHPVQANNLASGLGCARRGR